MVKNVPAGAGDARDRVFAPWVGRSPGGANGHPLQFSWMESSMDKRSLSGYSPWGRRESGTAELACRQVGYP